MKTHRLLIIAIIVLGVFVFAININAQGKREMFRKQSKPPSRIGKMADPSGLLPVFPENVTCIGIASPYGSQTRYDGSSRPKFRFGGRHGGIDLSLKEGTPLLALAGGTIIAKGEGGRMEGIYPWLKHSPENTSLSYWIFSKYQHLQSMPDLPIGATVTVGQIIALSGKTGTTGGHYGNHGYPHLHLSIRKGSKGDIKLKGSGKLLSGLLLIDPLTIYFEAGSFVKNRVDSSIGAKEVLIPVITSGQLKPEKSSLVWPVACNLNPDFAVGIVTRQIKP